MSSKTSDRRVGLAPLVAGAALVWSNAGEVASGDLVAVSGFAAGCAAVLVGVGILLGWREFDPETGDDGGRRRATLALAGTALAGFAVGAASVVL